jgi:hypothetical protein
MTTTETITGGITTVKKQEVAAHVTGDVFAETAQGHPSRASRGANGAEQRAMPHPARANHAPVTARSNEEPL